MKEHPHLVLQDFSDTNINLGVIRVEGLLSSKTDISHDKSSDLSERNGSHSKSSSLDIENPDLLQGSFTLGQRSGYTTSWLRDAKSPDHRFLQFNGAFVFMPPVFKTKRKEAEQV